MMKPPAGSGGSPPRAGAVEQIGRALVRMLVLRELRLLLTCAVVLGMAGSFVMPFLSLFFTEGVKLSLRDFGVLMTANAVANITLSTLIAHRSDTHYARRTLMLVGALAGALGYVGYAFVREPWLLFLLGGGVLGVASQTFSQLFASMRDQLERSAVPATEVPLYMNAFRMSFALAWTVGPALAAFVLERLSFRGLFCGAGLLYLAFFVLVLGFVEHAPPSERARARARAARLRDVLGRRGVPAWFGALTLMLAAHAMAMNNMSLLVIHTLGGDESQVGVIFSLAPLFELPFMLYVGMLATRVPSERLMRVAMLLAVVYYAGLASVHAPYQIYPLQALSAAIVSVTGGIAITFFQSKLPDQLGSATNLYSNAARLGSTSSYLAFGLIASRFGYRGAAVASGLLALMALALTALPSAREPAPE